MYRVTVVCSGNICRSPMGEVILRHLLDDAGLADRVEVDSCGIGGWHEGDGADPRTVRALADAGYDGSAHIAHQITPQHLTERDLVLAADETHVRDLRRLAAKASGPTGEIRLMREFDPKAVEAGTLEVDDPYYGDAAGFTRCAEEVEAAMRGVVKHLRASL